MSVKNYVNLAENYRKQSGPSGQVDDTHKRIMLFKNDMIIHGGSEEGLVSGREEGVAGGVVFE